ncbi:YjbF family lipoprotein [Celerinatantimonas sp. MCCC 1A17872]|uniref:YjbF family lipoprotein n=1 Tax=Celerinatantimonas sp. MCCC 1A17872 TaxID=3177514 RepID=UPI0038CABB01
MLKNLICIISFAVLVSGCTSDSQMAYRTIRDALSTPSDVTISSAQLSKLPYAASYAQLGSNARALIILASAKGDERLWVTKEKEALVTRHGRIIRTDDLKKANFSVHFSFSDPLSGGIKALSKHPKAHGVVDFMPGYHYGLAFSAEYKVVGKQTLIIGGVKRELTQVDERYSLAKLDFHTVNHYWLDNHGLVWQSRQQYIPNLPSIHLTLLKAYRQDLK